MASTTVIILVSDPDDPKHGQVTVVDDPFKAERIVETLLEAGYERERFRVFSGKENELRVSYRPVVSLTGDSADESRESGDHSTNGDGQSGPRFSEFFRKSFDDAGS